MPSHRYHRLQVTPLAAPLLIVVSAEKRNISVRGEVFIVPPEEQSSSVAAFALSLVGPVFDQNPEEDFMLQVALRAAMEEAAKSLGAAAGDLTPHPLPPWLREDVASWVAVGKYPLLRNVGLRTTNQELAREVTQLSQLPHANRRPL